MSRPVFSASHDGVIWLEDLEEELNGTSKTLLDWKGFANLENSGLWEKCPNLDPQKSPKTCTVAKKQFTMGSRSHLTYCGGGGAEHTQQCLSLGGMNICMTWKQH